jgi:hypothetical protein
VGLTVVGETLGLIEVVGETLGLVVGEPEGWVEVVGEAEGLAVGPLVGGFEVVGETEGLVVGDFVGDVVGAFVGALDCAVLKRRNSQRTIGAVSVLVKRIGILPVDDLAHSPEVLLPENK